MKQNKPKYKIIYQSRENVRGTYHYKKKFHALKWSRLTKKLDKTRNFLFKKFRKPHTLKIMKKHRLLNKQKFKSFYGHLSYNYLKSEYKTIQQRNSFNIINRLQIVLEHRIDIFLFRSGVFPTIFHAKQAINHNKIYVNETVVSNSNYKLKPGDFIQIPKNNTSDSFNELPYSKISLTRSLILFLRAPKSREIRYPFNFYPKYLSSYLNKN
jgi:ribosomal protein S4